MNDITAQLIPALRIASAHGHMWAGAFADEAALVGLTRETFLAACEAYAAFEEHADLPGGITAPYFDPEGDISHVTGTGRLSWCIDEAGSTCLIVSRPLSDDADGYMVADARVDAGGVIRTFETEYGCEGRHWTCLRDAVSAVAGRNVTGEMPVPVIVVRAVALTAARALQAAAYAAADFAALCGGGVDPYAVREVGAVSEADIGRFEALAKALGWRS